MLLDTLLGFVFIVRPGLSQTLFNLAFGMKMFRDDVGFPVLCRSSLNRSVDVVTEA